MRADAANKVHFSRIPNGTANRSSGVRQVVFRTGWPFADSKKDKPWPLPAFVGEQRNFSGQNDGGLWETYSSKALTHMLAIINTWRPIIRT